MNRVRMFDLEQRTPLTTKKASSLEDARGFDLSARVSMFFPMERMVKIISPFCKKGSMVVNIGSQTGLLPLMLGGHNPDTKVLGIEENELFVSVAEENMMLATMIKFPGKVDFQLGCLTDISLEDNIADIVIGYMPLYRCGNPVNLLKECSRICKQDGFVFIYALARDAEEGAISFVLQYISAGQDEFMESLKAAYTSEEIKQFLQEAGLSNWIVQKESLNVVISSKNILS